MVLGVALTVESVLSAVRLGCHNMSERRRQYLCLCVCVLRLCLHWGSRLVCSPSQQADSVSTKSRFIGIQIK